VAQAFCLRHGEMKHLLTNLPKRSAKPRQTGITLVIDKGLSVAEAENLLSVAEPYIDFIKLGFGTALFTQNLERKLTVYRNSRIHVFFGGTLFEAFVVRNQFDDYLRFLEQNKIEYAEVSDGSFRIPLREKCEYIRNLARHVNVLSEVGSKSENSNATPAEWVEAINSELDAGALSVIAEARDSGTVGICRSDGAIREELVLEISKHVPKHKLIWEAPIKGQQAWFIKSFGPNVNLGNIRPDDVIPLETLRSGLRYDTFATFAPMTERPPEPSKMIVEELADNRRHIGTPQFTGNKSVLDQHAKTS
jgi:phosphosulfolactate synthase